MAKIGHQALVSPSFDLFFKILMLQLAINVVLKDLVRQKKSRWEKSMGNDPRTQILGIQLHLEIHRKAPDSLPDSDSQNGLNGSCHHVVLRAFKEFSRSFFVAPGAARFGIPSRYSSSFLLPHDFSRPAWTCGTDRNFSTWKIDHRTQKVGSGSWFSYGI